jgi:hypothetical protein
MAECDERRWLAALSLMNSGMEADDASNKTFVAVMCPISQYVGRLFSPSVRAPVKTPTPRQIALKNDQNDRHLSPEVTLISNFGHKIDSSRF